jgi:hypothetical protein
MPSAIPVTADQGRDAGDDPRQQVRDQPPGLSADADTGDHQQNRGDDEADEVGAA